MNNQPTAADLMHLLVSVREKLEYMINATPTGAGRNSLCNANIHLMAAVDFLKETI